MCRRRHLGLARARRLRSAQSIPPHDSLHTTANDFSCGTNELAHSSLNDSSIIHLAEPTSTSYAKMGDVAVENPSNNVPPHKKAAPSTIPHIDTFEGVATDGGDDYATLKKLQRGLEYDLTYHIATTTVLMLNI